MSLPLPSYEKTKYRSPDLDQHFALFCSLHTHRITQTFNGVDTHAYTWIAQNEYR